MGFSPWVLPELSSPLEALVDVVSPAELCSGFPLSPGSKQLMALPLATPWWLLGCSRPSSAQAALAAPHLLLPG